MPTLQEILSPEVIQPIIDRIVGARRERDRSRALEANGFLQLVRDPSIEVADEPIIVVEVK